MLYVAVSGLKDLGLVPLQFTDELGFCISVLMFIFDLHIQYLLYVLLNMFVFTCFQISPEIGRKEPR
jgi:hypothetical protein